VGSLVTGYEAIGGGAHKTSLAALDALHCAEGVVKVGVPQLHRRCILASVCNIENMGVAWGRG
jgi:hypothetical protein